MTCVSLSLRSVYLGCVSIDFRLFNIKVFECVLIFQSFFYFVLISFIRFSNGGNQTQYSAFRNIIVSTYITQKRSISFEMGDFEANELSDWWLSSKSGFIDMLHRFRNISLNGPKCFCCILFLLLQSKGIFHEFRFFLRFQ